MKFKTLNQPIGQDSQFQQKRQKNKIKRMLKQKESQSTNEKTQSQQSNNPQRSKSMRKAATRLKQKQSQIDIIKKRFQVLRGQQDYNRYRTLDQQRRIKLHQNIHESVKSDRQSLEKQLQSQRELQQKQLREKHDNLLKQMKQKSQVAYNQLLSSRVNDRIQLKQQSLLNEQTIQKNRRQQIERNSLKKEAILSQEKRQREIVNQFKNSQVRNILGNRSMEASRLTQLTDAKDRQLNRLMEYEQEMLKKASQSIAINQKLKGEYGKVFVEVKERNSVRFPSISRQSGSYNSDRSNLSRNLSIFEV